MAMTERRPATQVASGERAEPRGFRPASRRRARIAGGAALAAVAVGGNVLVYSSLDDTTEVVQAVSNIRPGDVVTSDDLRIVEVDLDSTVPVVRADEIGLVVNQYARTYIASGSLVIPEFVQSTPLVAPGRSVIALEVRPTQVPANVRERSRVELVVVSDGAPGMRAEGRVVDLGSSSNDSATGVFPLSVELPADVAADFAAAEQVEVVLLDPAAGAAPDPAFDGDDG
jgi:hypothetical protein